MRSRFLAIALAAVIVLVAAILWLNSKGGGGLAKVPGLPQARLAPALVQVENGPESHPQAGLQKADVAYEDLTEGGITRFTLVYNQPSGGDRTEPVRSARLVTLKIQHLYQGVIFYSGASDRVQGMMWDQHLPALSESSDGGRYFSRDTSRPAPHNLVTTGDQLHAGLLKLNQRVIYALPAAAEPAGQGDPAARIAFQQTFVHSVSYAYSASDKTYAYTGEFGPLVDADGGGKPVAITNVVLVRVAHHSAGYTEDVVGSEGIDFDLQGSLPAEIYTRGRHFKGTFDATGTSGLQLAGSDGKAFHLPAGLTWVHLVDPETQVNAT